MYCKREERDRGNLPRILAHGLMGGRDMSGRKLLVAVEDETNERLETEDGPGGGRSGLFGAMGPMRRVS